jgi:copper chaperone CopZ
MNKALIGLLLGAGAVAAVIAYRAPTPDDRPVAAAEGVAPVPDRLTAVPAEGEVVRVLDVTGMCCRGCSGKLYRRLVAVEGVRDACVDFDTGTASAIAANTVAPATLASALTFETYSASARP